MAHEFDGEKYQKVSAHQKEWGNKLITELNLTGKEKILDLGCGDGSLSQSLSRLVPYGSVLGIDASKGMMEVAKEKERTNLKFLLMDIDDLVLNEKFDIVFSNAALHWVKDHQKLYDTLLSVLSPNGMIRFNFAADGNCSYFFSIVKQTIQSKEYREYFKSFEWPWFMPSQAEYREMISTLPFSNTEIWGENADRFFPDKEALTGWIEQPSIVPFLAYLPDSAKEAFTQKVIAMMLDATLQEDGRYFETFRRINVLIRK